MTDNQDSATSKTTTAAPSLSPTEQVILCTLRLGMRKGGKPIGSGSGFYFSFPLDNGKHLPAVVTNKHVADPCDEFELTFTAAGSSGLPDPSTKTTAIYRLDQNSVIRHPSDDVDVCLIPINAAIEDFTKKKGWRPLFYTVNLDHVPSDEEWNSFQAIEEVIMVGYPIGLADLHNNLPITRHGITATPPSSDFLGRREFVIDMACFPGSSGSPVFICNTGGFTNRQGGMNIGGVRIRFLGILYGGPGYDAEGKIEVREIPTSEEVIAKVKVMMNLGYVVRSDRFRDFIPILKAKFPS